MYLTQNKNENFDWDEYFNNIDSYNGVPEIDYKQFFINMRQVLKEDEELISLSMGGVLRNLLRDLKMDKPDILELGAGTGFLSRILLTMYGGKSVLVDKCNASYNAFLDMKSKFNTDGRDITYIVDDIFNFSTEQRFDIVCSFGVVEHFPDKKEIVEVHKKFLTENGVMIIIIPMDSKLTRMYYETFPEKNLGYRELLSKKEIIAQLKEIGVKPIKVEISSGYVYDYLAVLC